MSCLLCKRDAHAVPCLVLRWRLFQQMWGHAESGGRPFRQCFGEGPVSAGGAAPGGLSGAAEEGGDVEEGLGAALAAADAKAGELPGAGGATAGGGVEVVQQGAGLRGQEGGDLVQGGAVGAQHVCAPPAQHLCNARQLRPPAARCAEQVAAVLPVVEHDHGITDHLTAGAGDKQVEPPVMKRHLCRARSADQRNGGLVEHGGMAGDAVFHLSIAEGGRAMEAPGEAEGGAGGVYMAGAGAVDDGRVGGHIRLFEVRQSLFELEGIPDVVLIGEGDGGVGQAGMTEQGEEMRRGALAWAIQQPDPAGVRCLKGTQDRAGVIGGAIIRGPERPVHTALWH